ncbi:MAG: hypothetical protein NUV61_04500 [Candidatus Azambacteria bacterium]|nr:hypothetical protein [Candidatus Azambacteria bacterium]
MILAPHMLVGAALATYIHHPALLALSASSVHYLLDVAPHWEYAITSSKRTTAYKIIADIATGLFIIFFVLQRFDSPEQALILWGAFFGIVPDGLSAIYFFSRGKYLRRQMQFHVFWHTLIVPKETDPPRWLGIMTEVIVVAIALFLLLR